jgi:hypothetical protein
MFSLSSDDNVGDPRVKDHKIYSIADDNNVTKKLQIQEQLRKMQALHDDMFCQEQTYIRVQGMLVYMENKKITKLQVIITSAKNNEELK